MADISSIKINDNLYDIKDNIARQALANKQDALTFDALPTEGSGNPVTSDGIYKAMSNNLDDVIPSIINGDNYLSLMRLWFSVNGAAALTDFSALCDRWYALTRTGWTGGTRFYHWPGSGSGEGTKVGDNAGMVAQTSTNDTAGRDDYQAVPLFHCLDCNWMLDEDGKPHITAIEGVCGNFERYNPAKLVGVIQMTGWHRYVDDAENDVFTHMYTDETGAAGYHPLPEAVNPDGTVRTWVVHAKYASGDDYGCYSGVHPWTYTASYNSAITAFHGKWGNQYGGKTSADDAFLKLIFYLKYANLSADGVLQGCVAYNFQYAVAETETGVERVILTAAQAANIKVGSTVMVGNPTAFSSGTTLNIDRSQTGMRAKVDRKKVMRKETLASGRVAIYVDNGGVAFNTTENTLQGTKSVGPTGIITIDDAVGGTALGLTVNIEPVQSGTGDPSPDNVRPISGWTGVKAAKSGKNLCPVNAVENLLWATDNPDLLAFINTLKDGTYTISFKSTLTSLNSGSESETWITGFIFTNSDRNFSNQIFTDAPHPVGTVASGFKTLVINAANRGKFTHAYCYGAGNNSAGVIGTATLSEIQIELGSTVTEYEPYQGITYDIIFPSEAGTVYGGTLDVMNGTLEVDRAQISSYAGETLPGTWISDRDVYAAGATPTTGAQVVYKLAAPITYQLTPQEIALVTGNNSIAADCGDTAIQYAANIPSPTYISTSPWFTGTCDNVKGVDGSPTSPGNGTEPVILQGIEYALGAYEVVCDSILKYYKDSSDKYHMIVYVCRDASKYSMSVTSDYELVDYEVDCPASSSWQYIAELGYDADRPEAWFPHLIGCTSSQRTKDAIYILNASTSSYEWLSLGHLERGTNLAGLSIALALALSSSYWYILARLSPTGNRGTYNGGGN